MAPLSVTQLEGLRVASWHVRDGQLLVRTNGEEMPVVCECGRTHMLLTEELALHRLVLWCHGCHRRCEVALA